MKTIRTRLGLLSTKVALIAGLFLAGVSLQAQYCIPSGNCSFGDEIQNFTLNTINNNTSCTGGYSDFSGSISTTLNAGIPYPYSATFGYSDQGLGMWLDINQDGDFDDVGEFVSSVPYVFGSFSANGSLTISGTVNSGTYRLRVRNWWNNDFLGFPGEACQAVSYGETEDYTVVVVNNACVAPPNPGVANAPASVCAGVAFNVSLSGMSLGSGQTYQWQSSPNGTTWASIPGATNINLSTTANSPTHYRCIVTCSGQSDTSGAGVLSTIIPANICNVCASSGMFSGDTYLEGVQLGAINAINTACANYTDNTNLSTLVIKGGNYSGNIIHGDCDGGGVYSRGVLVWADWNANGLFTDPGEQLMSISAPGTASQAEALSFTVPLNAANGPILMRVIASEDGVTTPPCGSYFYGETEDYVLIVADPPYNDAGIAQLISPSPNLCFVSDTIRVRLENVGQVPLTTCQFNVRVNNGSVQTFNWTGNIGPNTAQNVFVGSTVLNDGDFLKVWTSLPNGVQDSLNFNDTLQQNVYQSMNGIYTIGGSNPNFSTINAALSALQTRGACGNVTLNVRSGTYVEQMRLQTFPGNATSSVVLQSEVQNADSVRIQFAANTQVGNYVAWFETVEKFTLNQVTLAATGFSFSTNVLLSGNGKDNTIQNSKIIGDTLATFDSNNSFNIKSLVDNDNNFGLLNNTIWGGSRAVSLSGTSAANPEKGVRLIGNTIEKFYFVGVGLFNHENPVVNGNTIIASGGNTNMFRLYLNTVYNGCSVSGNKIGGSNGGFGVNMDGVSGSVSNSAVLSNNFIHMGDTMNAQNSEAIYIQNGSNLMNVYHNSVAVYSQTANSAALTIGVGANVDINLKNNIFAHYGQGAAYEIDGSLSIASSNNNDLFTANGPLARYAGTTHSNLAAFSAATGHDLNSISVDPLFTNLDMHTCLVDFDNVGVGVGVMNDVDGDTRNATTPDLGADEFVLPATFTLGNDIYKCSSDSVMLGAEVILDGTYYWSTFSNDPLIYVSAPGEYSLTLVANCGVVDDTIEVFDIPAPVANFTSINSFYTYVFTNTSTNSTSYSWNFGDGNTSTDVNPLHIYGSDGTYTVTLTATNSCGETNTKTMQVTVNVTSIEESDAASIQVYPNPTSGITTLTIQGLNSTQAEIQLMDLTGRILMTKQVELLSEGVETTLNMSKFAAGVYVVRIQSGDFKAVRRIVRK
ncbi:MAG: T9SS type A sorting domain-containing protein [Bacteroidetes bacterium]|nr:T9SS type A sorting domain-containing protein [Bacteroidota bacterium]